MIANRIERNVAMIQKTAIIIGAPLNGLYHFREIGKFCIFCYNIRREIFPMLYKNILIFLTIQYNEQ